MAYEGKGGKVALYRADAFRILSRGGTLLPTTIIHFLVSMEGQKGGNRDFVSSPFQLAELPRRLKSSSKKTFSRIDDGIFFRPWELAGASLMWKLWNGIAFRGTIGAL
ncbi:hypothetical protein KM043_017178 [Ampulex compressa]|nr:hypothetical protein KM043_017178 [Ampulex compressa]